MLKKNKEFFEVFLYVVISAADIYFVPPPLNKYLFLILLPITWRSKRDYLWLAYFFILLDQPGGFFSGGERDDYFRLPVYTLTSGISFTILELYYLLLVVKILSYPSKYPKHPVFFSKELRILAILFFTLVAISPLLGYSFDSIKATWKIFINLTLFFSTFYILNNQVVLSKFLRILLPFPFIAIFLQIHSIINGQQLIVSLNIASSYTSNLLNAAGKNDVWLRPIELVSISFITFTSTLFLLLNKNQKDFSRTYLVIINIASFISIFLTGTRSWFLGFLSSYSLILLLKPNFIFKRFLSLSFAAFLAFFLINNISPFKKQIVNAWSRLSTLEEFVEYGEFKETSAAQRYEERAPKVMKGFSKSTILFGAAFSDINFKNQDSHVGYHNLLLNTGIIGILTFAFCFLSIFYKCYLLSRKKEYELTILFLFLFAPLLIINTGTQTIGFNIGIDTRFYMLAYVLALLQISYLNSLMKQ